MTMESFPVKQSIFTILLVLAALCAYHSINQKDAFSSTDTKINRGLSISSSPITETQHKVFKIWDNKQFPCFDPQSIAGQDFERNSLKIKQEAEAENLKGLIYIKVPKTASSTLSGINLRISSRHIPSNSNMLHCACTFHHHRASDLNLYKRSRVETFLWTIMRQPASQFISKFFHGHVARHGAEANIEEFKFFFNKKFHHHEFDPPQIDFISPRLLTLDDLKSKGAREDTVREIINEYDFMGVTERLDESLVALQLILGLDAGDILYVSAKVNGGYDDGAYQNKCFKIPPSILSKEMKEFTYSPEWRKRFAFPTMLYEAVNKSLDLTIENIGQDVFAKALKEHRYLMSLVNDKCAPTAIFPCSKEGVLQTSKSNSNCYWSDSGCGYPCLDQLYLNFTSYA